MSQTTQPQSTDRPENPAKTSPGEFGVILAVAAVLVLGVVLWMRYSADPEGDRGGLSAGVVAPPLEAVLWVNGEPSDSPSGVRVVHAWSYSCPYCWKEAPELVRLHEEFGDRVEFVGLAGEEVANRRLVEDFVEKNNFSWPNGFGEPFTTLIAFDVRLFPAVFVLDREGRVVWSRGSKGSLEQAISSALDG